MRDNTPALIVLILITGSLLGMAGADLYLDRRDEQVEEPPDPILTTIEHEIAYVRGDIRDLRVILERGIVTIPSKPHVRIAPNVEGMLTPQISRVLGLALAWSVRENKSVDINSFNDSSHIRRSLHYLNLAIDLDVGGDRLVDLTVLGAFLVLHLPGEYDVIVHDGHVHVEWEEE